MRTHIAIIAMTGFTVCLYFSCSLDRQFFFHLRKKMFQTIFFFAHNETNVLKSFFITEIIFENTFLHFSHPEKLYI